MTAVVRLNEAQLLRVYNAARWESDTTAALRLVQEAVLAANQLLPATDAAALRCRIECVPRAPRASA